MNKITIDLELFNKIFKEFNLEKYLEYYKNNYPKEYEKDFSYTIKKRNKNILFNKYDIEHKVYSPKYITNNLIQFNVFYIHSEKVIHFYYNYFYNYNTPGNINLTLLEYKAFSKMYNFIYNGIIYD